jgi:glycogen debranching enzyme
MVVEPDLTLPSDGSPLPMDALMIQSVVPKWMGPMKSWDRFFKFIRYSGYNMIHFVPMQQRGSSDSPYALADQLTFSDGLFEDASTLCAHDRYVLVKKTLGHLERNYGMLALSDVVWTHTSNDSPFLLDHPDVGYNLHNSPHLVSAYELDSALVNLSGQLDQLGLKSTIDSTADVEAIVGHIQHYTIPDLRLYEYRVVNVAKYMDLMRKQLAGKLSEGIDTSLYQALEVHNLSLKQQVDLVIDRHLIADGPHIGTRFHKTINIPEMASFLLALDQINDTNQVLDYNHIQHLIGKFKMILDEYNLPFYHDHDRDMHVAVENIKSRMIFVRLAENGPHLGPITST